MPRSCSAYECNNADTTEARESGLRFYRIPVEPERRRVWLNALRRKDFDPKPDACICSKHFISGKEGSSSPIDALKVVLLAVAS